MSVSTKDLKVGDVLKLKKFPEHVYVVVKDANNPKVPRLLNMNVMSVCRDDGEDMLDSFLHGNNATKVGHISTLWRV